MKDDRECPIIPRPKRWQRRLGRFVLSDETAIIPARNSTTRVEARSLSRLLAEGTGVRCRGRRTGKGGAIKLDLVARLPGTGANKEGYRIHATPGEVRLQAVSGEGLFYACQSLLNLIERDGAGWSIPACEVRDWPDFSYRGFMVDPARGFAPVAYLKWAVDNLARSKLNVLHLHMADAESFTLPTRRYPRLNAPMKGNFGVYTRADIRDLAKHAAARKIQLVPEIDLPGHARRLVTQYSELLCRPPHGKPSQWCICIGAESTYRFLDRLLGEVAPLFPGDLFHIGTDELEFKDKLDRVNFSWRECSACRLRMKQEGLSGYQELVYYFLSRMRTILARYGKRMMMWNDNIDMSKPHPVERDVLIHFWRVAGRGRGPWRGCSMAKFARDKFQIVNSYYPETYYLLSMLEERLVQWNPQKNPPLPKAFRKQVIGGECCAWEGENRDQYACTWPAATALFGDRVWNIAPIKNADAFAGKLARHIFGPQTPEGMAEYFHVTGAIIPRRNSLFQLEPPLLQPIPRKARRKQCKQVLRAINSERRKKRLMNDDLLASYAQALRALEREL